MNHPFATLEKEKSRERRLNKKQRFLNRTTEVERWLESDNNWLEVRSIEEVFDGWSNDKSMIEPLFPIRSFGYSKLKKIINLLKKNSSSNLFEED